MHKKEKGFGLIEVLFATFFITLAVGGAFLLIQRNVSSVTALEHRAIATALAQEGIEVAFVIRNSNYIDAVQGGSSTFTSNGLQEEDGAGNNVCGPPDGCDIRCHNNINSANDCPPPPGGTIEIKLDPAVSGAVSGKTLCFDGHGYSAHRSSSSCSWGPGVHYSLFKRKIVVDESPGDYVSVTATVWWLEKGNQQSVELETRLYDWLLL